MIVPGPGTPQPGINKTNTRGPTLNDILSKLNNAKYLSHIDASSVYHNLKTRWKIILPHAVWMPVWKVQIQQLTFGSAEKDNMFQRKIDAIFKEMPNVFEIVDDILVAGYEDDGRDHDKTVQRVLQRCRQVNSKLNKDKCHFRCTSVPFFGEVISQNGVQPDPQKIKALVKMPPPKIRKLQAFLGIINYLNKFSPSTASMCDPLWKLTSSSVVWMWNASYQTLYNKTKSLIKDDICMKLYDKTKPLYLETDASGIGLGVTLLQMRDGATCPKDITPNKTILRPIVFVSKSLTSAEQMYSNSERDV